ncbi:MAG: DUF2489 domain-containing protein [Bacteriovoracaceae bacterium]|jgi:hypothetical protein|nr:DUF2489 domain-containing protein [Bacteriovoracaceae bacterium]
MNTKFIIIFIILILVVFGLSIYLGVLYSKLKAQKAKDKELQKQLQEKIDDIRHSIEMISQATSQGQCEPAESCLRLYNLLSRLELLDNYPVIKEFHQKIKDLSILKQRQELSAKAAFAEDKIRIAAEEEFKDRFEEEIKKIYTDFK